MLHRNASYFVNTAITGTTLQSHCLGERANVGLTILSNAKALIGDDV
jgi:hypothetical protein